MPPLLGLAGCRSQGWGRDRDRRGQPEPPRDGRWGRARRWRSYCGRSGRGTPGTIPSLPQGAGSLPVTVPGRTAVESPRADTKSPLEPARTPGTPCQPRSPESRRSLPRYRLHPAVVQSPRSPQWRAARGSPFPGSAQLWGPTRHTPVERQELLSRAGHGSAQAASPAAPGEMLPSPLQLKKNSAMAKRLLFKLS